MNGTQQVETQSERAAKAGSLAAVLDRYRPAALAVAAIIAVVTVLPGADDPGSGSASAVAALPFEEVAAPGLEAAPAPPADGAVAEPPTLVAEPVSAPVAVPEAAPLDSGFSDVPAMPAEAPAPAAEEPEPAPAEQEAAPPPAAAPAPDAPAAAVEPLALTTTGYASRTAGTPLAANGVPADSLPIGMRVGVLDKASYVRLSGTATRLVLEEVATGTRGDATTVTLKACQITVEGWQGEQAQSFDEAPEHDATKCAPGTRSTTGAWTFDLTAFPTRTDDRGFALVPGGEGATDFQVALKG